MKSLITILSLVLIMQLIACKKDQTVTDTILIGKWKEVGSLISNGGPLYYVPSLVKADYDYAQFNSNGTINGTVFSDYATYAVKDNATVVFTKPDKTTIQNYSYQLKGDTLKMSPAGPIFCIEGCVIVFVKAK